MLVLVSQPAVGQPHAAVSVQKGPSREGCIDSPDGTTAGPLDQQHVLERFVGTHKHCWYSIIKLFLHSVLMLCKGCGACRHSGLTRSCKHNEECMTSGCWFIVTRFQWLKLVSECRMGAPCTGAQWPRVRIQPVAICCMPSPLSLSISPHFPKKNKKSTISQAMA